MIPATEVWQKSRGSPRKLWRTGLFISVALIAGGMEVNLLKHFLRDEQGAELAEYAVGTAILVAVAIIVYKVLGDAVNVKMSTVANEVQK